MPLYTYICQSTECKHSEEKIVKLSERDNERDCSKCEDGKMQREAFTAGDKGATFRYRGNWFATTGRY